MRNILSVPSFCNTCETEPKTQKYQLILWSKIVDLYVEKMYGALNWYTNKKPIEFMTNLARLAHLIDVEVAIATMPATATLQN